MAKVQHAPETAIDQQEPRTRRIFRHVDEYSQILRKMPACTNPFVTFSPKPQNVHFESQAEQENIVLFVRRHLITQAGWVVTAIILALLPLALRVVPLIDFFPDRFHLPLLLGWYTFLLGFVLENFLVWFFNVNIFTDERIVDIDFYSLLSKKISTAQIDRVEDVTSMTSGFLGSMLNYGHVDIQTAGNARELNFEEVPHPDKIVQILNELIMEEERERLEGRVQ
jgi:hypothetical protein